MKSCPTCHEKYGNQVKFCPADGAQLQTIEERGDPYIGATLAGRYKVLERLGAGGFGTVYKVTDTRLEHVRALKVLNHHRLPPEEIEKAAGRFEREAKLMGRLGDRSRHIVGVTDFVVDEEEGLFFFAMPFVEGRNLAQILIREGPLPSLRAVRIARQLCSALATAHAEEVVHRDLKLENLMIVDDAEGRTELLRVLDFGIAKVLDQKSLTDVTMGAPGTPGYAAPEQVLDPKKIDARTDLFSMGVVLYGVLTGREPWKGTVITEPTSEGWSVIQASISVDPKPPEEFRPDIPPRLASLILRMLAKEQEDRPRSAREVDDELAEIEGELLQGSSQPTIALVAPTTQQLAAADATGGGRKTGAAGPRTGTGGPRTTGGRPRTTGAAVQTVPEGFDEEPGAPPTASPARAWKIAVPFAVAAGALAVYLLGRPTQLAYAQFVDYVEAGQVLGVEVGNGSLTANVEGESGGEYRVDLSGRPLHSLLTRLRSAGVPILGAGAGRVSLQAVRAAGGEAAEVPLALLDSTGPVCEPCAAGSLVRVGSGWYRVQASGGRWAIDSLQIVVDGGGFDDEKLAGGGPLFVPADAVLQIRVAVSEAAPAVAAPAQQVPPVVAEAPPSIPPTTVTPPRPSPAAPQRTAQREPAPQTRPSAEPSRPAPAQLGPPPAASPAASERPAENRPTTGTLAVRGSLSGAARAVVVGPAGERPLTPGAELDLPAGSYVVRTTGLYREPVETQVTIPAGGSGSVSLSDPPLARAVVAGARGVMDNLVQRLSRRSADLLPLLPAAQRQTYRSLFESRAISNWEARVTSADDEPTLDGDDVTLGFAVLVSFTQQNVRTELPIRFRAHLEQAGGSWRARALDILP